MYMLELKGLTKQYLYGARVLSALDLVVQNGEIIAVLGGEGSGKTTFIKAVSGATDSEGEILIDGKALKHKTDDVIVLFDDGALFKRKTVYKNLAYPLKIRKTSEAEIDARVKAAAELAGVAPVLYSPIFMLNAVDRRKVSAARLFLREAKVLLLDELTAHLEREEAENLWREYAPLLLQKKAEGKIIIFATADAEEAVSVADRIIVLHAGEIKQIGTVDEILNTPASVWAAEALDNCYNSENVLLEERGGELFLIFENKYVLSAELFRGRISESYIGKQVLAGWHGADFSGLSVSADKSANMYDRAGDKSDKSQEAVENAVRMEAVQFALRTANGYVLHTASGKKALRAAKERAINTLPDISKVRLFDASNENSIMTD
jgi:ABC-type Fe3+/spermidine/putrescine transport system ATPase subunit